jgi:hypothetical protein
MPTAQQSAIAAGLAAALAAAGVAVDYVQSATRKSAVGLKALRGHSTFESVDSGGMVTNFESVDWIFAAAELAIDDASVAPASGDLVVVTTPSGHERFEVLKLSGQKPYRLDSTGVQLRVHTKRVGSSG